MGYAVDIACARCGDSIDTVFHRLYTCVHAKDTAIEILGPRLHAEAVAAGADDLFFNRLMLPSNDQHKKSF